MFFFARGDWEFVPSEVIEGPRVPWETSIPLADAQKDPPLLSEEEVDRINTILAFTQKK